MPAWKSLHLGKAKNYFKLRTDHRQECNNLSWITTYFRSSKANTTPLFKRSNYTKTQCYTLKASIQVSFFLLPDENEKNPLIEIFVRQWNSWREGRWRSTLYLFIHLPSIWQLLKDTLIKENITVPLKRYISLFLWLPFLHNRIDLGFLVFAYYV